MGNIETALRKRYVKKDYHYFVIEGVDYIPESGTNYAHVIVTCRASTLIGRNTVGVMKRIEMEMKNYYNVMYTKTIYSYK